MGSKRVSILILTAVLAAASFTSCGGGTSQQSSVPSQSSTPASSAPTASGTESSAPGAAASPDIVNGAVNQQTYPLVTEKITLDYWYPEGGSIGELGDFNDGEFWQWYEEKTNVHINFIVPAAGTEADAFQLLFASGNMPDMLETYSSSQNYRGGEDKAIEDGYFADLSEHPEWTPNYMSWIDNGADSGLQRAVYTDAGRMYGHYIFWLPMYDEPMADQGISIRKDFLDKVGMEPPVTYDQWHDVLTAFKDQLGIDAPLYTSKYGIDITGEFMAGYGTAPYFYQVDNKVKYGPMDDEYRDYLVMLNQWWQEGLLDRDFATRTSSGIAADNDMMLNDKVGALVDYGSRLSDTYISRGATNPEFYCVGVEQPTKGDGSVPKFRKLTGSDRMCGGVFVYAADSPHLETAIRWGDGMYAEDVYLNANYGLESAEGKTWQKAPDGHRVGIYDFRYSNPDGLSSATVLAKYWVKSPSVRVEAAQIEQSDENKQAGWKIWSKYPADWFYPTRATMTTEEKSEYASLYTDIETYVQECNVKFIMGQMPLDSYDSYRETLKTMGIDRCIELQQTALDRYTAR